MLRVVSTVALIGLVGFVLLTSVLTVRNFGIRGLVGDPVLPHGVVVSTPTAQAAATRMAAAPTPTRPVSRALRGHPQLLSFPKAVMVPPDDLVPFSDLTLESVSSSGAACPTAECVPRYTLEYGPWISGGARLAGTSGRGTFEAAVPSTATCTSAGQYCTRPTPGRPNATATAEYFGGLTVGPSQPAVVAHLTCCAGPYWSVTWYDAGADVTYTLELSRHLAETYGTSLADNNIGAARRLCELARQLVRLV